MNEDLRLAFFSAQRWNRTIIFGFSVRHADHVRHLGILGSLMKEWRHTQVSRKEMNTGGHYPSCGRGIWTHDLLRMRQARWPNFSTPRHYLLGTHLRDASLFCYHYTTGCSLPTGIRTQTFSLAIKILKKKLLYASQTLWIGFASIWGSRHASFYYINYQRITPTGLEPVSPAWKADILDQLDDGALIVICLSLRLQPSKSYDIGVNLLKPPPSVCLGRIQFLFIHNWQDSPNVYTLMGLSSVDKT